MRVKRYARLAAAALVVGLRPGCAALDPRGIAEKRLSDSVATSVAAMAEVVATASDDAALVATDYTTVARSQLLSGLTDQPEGAATDTLYCLDRVDGEITACVFYPMDVDIPSGLDGFYASVYGCAELSGIPGSRDITVKDAECPQKLVDWFSERSSIEVPDAVSIAAVFD